MGGFRWIFKKGAEGGEFPTMVCWRQRRVNQRAKITRRQRCRKPLELPRLEERNELRSYGSRGRMLLCRCRDGGKHRPIYWEKIVPWWWRRGVGGGGGTTDLRADLDPFFSAQSNLSSRRGRGVRRRRRGEKRERKEKQKQTLLSRQRP